MDWETIIGLEIHAELATASKMFSPCPVLGSTETEPNTAVDEFSLGLPGTLPTINRKALEYATRVALALGCEIPPYHRFARKNYFYPDLPKGYQISQYEQPLAIQGKVMIETGEKQKIIRIRRAHLEEDTGKLSHTNGGISLVDYNRAGIPLLEIVSEPDLRSAEEAEAYAQKIRSIMRYLGVNHGDMSKGVLRLEANVSVRPSGEESFRQRTEIKNLNSLRSLKRAIQAEAKRQITLWGNGEEVRSATIGWDEDRQDLVIQRYKEEADEYRYFPEPDLPTIHLPSEWVEAQRESLVELPEAKRTRFMQDYDLVEQEADVLVSEQVVAAYFEELVGAGIDPKSAAHWIMGELFALMNRHQLDKEQFAEIPIRSAALAELLTLLKTEQISRASTVTVLAEMWQRPESAAAIVERLGLQLVDDDEAVKQEIQQVLEMNPDLVLRYHAGEEKLFGALMGMVMRALAGKGKPALVRQILTAKLNNGTNNGDLS